VSSDLKKLLTTSRQDWFGTPDNTRKIDARSSRVLPLQETLAKAKDLSKSVSLSRLGSIHGLDRVGIPCYTAVRGIAEPGNLAVMGGKGITLDHAKTSALMESIERHCGERNDRLGDKFSYSHSRQASLDPKRLILSKYSTYQDSQLIEWWPATDLLKGESVWVPAAAVLNPYPESPYLFSASSNGLASGNTYPEALLHALYEVIERDGTSFAELLGLSKGIRLESIQDNECLELISLFQTAGITVFVRWIEHSTGIPIFMVILDDPISKDPMLINSGYGCSLDPNIALSRALTEAALSRATVIAGARDNLAEEEIRRKYGYDVMHDALQNTLLVNKTEYEISEVESVTNDNITDDLHVLLGRLNRAGFEQVYAASLELPEIGVPVVRAIIPGMELCHIQRDRVGIRLREAFVNSTKLRSE